MHINEIAKEVIFTAVRSRGPGGQNVNKVSSAAFLVWDYLTSQGLTLEEKGRVRIQLKNIINRENQIYLRSDEYRDLERNKTRGFKKLIALLQAALHREKPRKKTKPTKASKVRKLETKRNRGEIKKNRGKVSWD